MHEKPLYLIIAECRCLLPDKTCSICRDRLRCHAKARFIVSQLEHDFVFTPKSKLLKQGFYPHTLSKSNYMFFFNKIANAMCDHINKDCTSCSSLQYCINLAAKTAASINFEYEVILSESVPKRTPISSNYTGSRESCSSKTPGK